MEEYNKEENYEDYENEVNNILNDVKASYKEYLEAIQKALDAKGAVLL